MPAVAGDRATRKPVPDRRHRSRPGLRARRCEAGGLPSRLYLVWRSSSMFPAGEVPAAL